MVGFAWPLGIYALILVLHLVVPGRWVYGYVRDAQGRPLRYRLNGLRVHLLVIALYVVAAWRGVIAWDVFWTWRWQMAASACAIGLLFSFALVWPAPRRGSFGADFYLGRLENPQWGAGRIDAKMLLYLFGAVMLELNVLSFAAHHVLLYPADPSPGVLLYVVMFSFFLAEYLTFEEVHLYTYDFFAERVGFKLGWGCLVFYPFFYCVGLWSVADRPNPHSPTWLLVLSLVLFFGGWMISRGANLQKFVFKTRPGDKLFGLLAPETVSADGKQLLCSGFWGLSRHINYLGEIAMALGLALVLGWPTAIGPWLYPLYYLVLLVPRQHFDDQRCAAKYGALWDEYCRRVRWRIVPGIY
jgi:delta14-sterol reductase